MSGSDVNVSYVTATGTVASGRRRLCGIHYHSGGSTGKIVLKDGGASGTTIATLDFHSNSTGDINFPDEGILFGTDIHATYTSITSATFFYK